MQIVSYENLVGLLTNQMDFELDFIVAPNYVRNIALELDQGDDRTKKKLLLQTSFSGEHSIIDRGAFVDERTSFDRWKIILYFLSW